MKLNVKYLESIDDLNNVFLNIFFAIFHCQKQTNIILFFLFYDLFLTVINDKTNNKFLSY